MDNSTNKTTYTRDNAVEEIDLIEIFYALLHKIWLIIAFTLVGLIGTALVTKFLITPQYEAKAMFYVLSDTTSISSMVDLQIGSSLTEDFIVLGTSRPVVERVIADCDLNASVEALRKAVKVTNKSNTHILEITCTNPDPELAAEIANAFARELKAAIADTMGKDEPNTIEDAIVPKSPVKPSLFKNAALGAIIGFIIACVIIIAMHLLDDTIKTEEDVKKWLGLSVIAAVPFDKATEASGAAHSLKKS